MSAIKYTAGAPLAPVVPFYDGPRGHYSAAAWRTNGLARLCGLEHHARGG
jgi:hypothetical protein